MGRFFNFTVSTKTFYESQKTARQKINPKLLAKLLVRTFNCRVVPQDEERDFGDNLSAAGEVKNVEIGPVLYNNFVAENFTLYCSYNLEYRLAVPLAEQGKRIRRPPPAFEET